MQEISESHVSVGMIRDLFQVHHYNMFLENLSGLRLANFGADLFRRIIKNHNVLQSLLTMAAIFSLDKKEAFALSSPFTIKVSKVLVNWKLL